MGSDPRPYKSRKIRPCDRCRKRKSRCIIEHSGPCQLCARMNVNCEFTDKVPPMNRHKAKQIPEGPETVCFVDFEDPVVHSKAEDKNDDMNSSREFSSNASELSSYTSFSTSLSEIVPTQIEKDAIQISIESTEGNHDLEIAGKSLGAVPIQGHTAMTDPTEDEIESDEHECQFVYLYHSGYLDPFLLQNSAALHLKYGKSHLKTLDSSCQPQMQILIENGNESNNTGLETSTFHPHTSNLFEIFLKHVNTHFPVVSAAGFQKLINQNKACFLLLTALILATDSWQKDPQLTLMERPDVDLVVRQVTQSILSEASNPSLAVMQSSLLLSQKLFLNGFGIDGTPELAILSVAYTLAQTMGINIDCTQWNISSWEKKIRRRLWWTLYIQEKWFSFSLGRRSHISKTDWNVCPLTEFDFENNSPSDSNEQARHSNRLFCLMAEMTELIDGIASEFDKHISLDAAYKAADLHLTRIAEFETKHSDYLRLENSKYPDSPIAALVIASVTAKATIHKTVLHRILSQEQEKSSDLDDDCKHRTISQEAIRRSIQLCAEILDILGRLRPYHFDSFWYSWARFNFATISSFFLLLNQVTSKHQEEQVIKLQMTKLQYFIQSRLPIFSHLGLASRVLELKRT
ncbi:hypothetical protein KL919_003987 [Ogataea angusta]|nr:hypothetical protein KL919_003987 [Ogataea angusta]